MGRGSQQVAEASGSGAAVAQRPTLRALRRWAAGAPSIFQYVMLACFDHAAALLA